MKCAIIADTHWGVRGDSALFLDNQKKFYDEIFFPYLKENNIKTVIIAGDLVDRRKYININTLSRMKRDFLDRLKEMEVYVIPGNHDTYYKDTNDLNALNELLGEYDFHIFNEPTTISLECETKVLFLPWICQENYDRSIKAIDDTDAQICVGHLEIEGFEMYYGITCEEGMKFDVFTKFDVVMTGHFHHKSSQGNIHYLGAPYQMTWHDYDDPKGFHIFDTSLRKLDFIKNPFDIFHKIVYSDVGKTLEEIQDMNWDFFKGTYVKVFVEKKENPYWFDLFTENLENYAHDVRIIEEIVKNDNAEQLDSFDSSYAILSRYIDESTLQIDKNKLKKFLTGLHNEAVQMDL